jgi:hypothetical protein
MGFSGRRAFRGDSRGTSVALWVGMKPILDITDQLTTVHGGRDLLAAGQNMQNYLDCFKQAQGKLNDGQQAAMTTAQSSSPTAGMTDMLSTGKTFQQDMKACAAKFPIK